METDASNKNQLLFKQCHQIAKSVMIVIFGEMISRSSIGSRHRWDKTLSTRLKYKTLSTHLPNPVFRVYMWAFDLAEMSTLLQTLLSGAIVVSLGLPKKKGNWQVVMIINLPRNLPYNKVLTLSLSPPYPKFDHPSSPLSYL